MIRDNTQVSLKCILQDRKTMEKLSALINPIKVIPSPEGLPRDWRGLAALADIEGTYHPQICASSDHFSKVLELWLKKGDVATVEALQKYLKIIDRYDVFNDTKEMIDECVKIYIKQLENPVDIKKAQNNLITYEESRTNKIQKYHAYVLHAVEDADFVSDLLHRMRRQGFRLCTGEDLAIGFSTEFEPISRLIKERCDKIIVILSPEFLSSSANAFYMNFAQAVGIEQNEVKLIPIVYKSCDIPPNYQYYHKLFYNVPGTISICNFWDKLAESLMFKSSLPRLPAKEEPSDNNKILLNGHLQNGCVKNGDSKMDYHHNSIKRDNLLTVPLSIKSPSSSSAPSKSSSYIDLRGTNSLENHSPSTLSLNKESKRKTKFNIKKLFSGLKPTSKKKNKSKVALEVV